MDDEVGADDDPGEEQERGRGAPRQTVTLTTFLGGRRGPGHGRRDRRHRALDGRGGDRDLIELHQHGRDVVATPGLFGRLHQLHDRLVEREGSAGEARQGVTVEFVGKSVTAQQEPITGERVQRHHVDRDGLFDPDAASQLVTSGMDRGLFRRESTHAHPLFGDAVVIGQLSKRTITQLIGPRVADVTERRRRDTFVVDRESQGDDRRTHTEMFGIVTRVIQDGDVGRVDGVVEALHRLVLGKSRAEQLDRHLGGDFAGRVSPHAVGHDG